MKYDSTLPLGKQIQAFLATGPEDHCFTAPEEVSSALQEAIQQTTSALGLQGFYLGYDVATRSISLIKPGNWEPLVPPPPKPAPSGLSFSVALDAIKGGHRVARTGWNGKGMFIYHVPANRYKVTSIAAKAFFGAEAMVPYGAYVAMKTADGTVVPWPCSQTDMLAEDWEIVS